MTVGGLGRHLFGAVAGHEVGVERPDGRARRTAALLGEATAAREHAPLTRLVGGHRPTRDRLQTLGAVDPRPRLEQRSRVRVTGSPVKLTGRRNLDEGAGVHDGDAVGDRNGRGQGRG